MMTYLRRRKKNITDCILRADGRHFDLELILAQFPNPFPYRNWIARNWETVCYDRKRVVASHLCL